MRALIAYGSKSGSTAEIAEALAIELRLAGLDVDVRAAGGVRAVEPYDVVLIGSALYAGRWRRDAMRLLRRETEALRSRQVWLFSSGLSVTGAHPTADPTPAAVAAIASKIGAHPPTTFAGALLPSTARGLLPRLMARGRSDGDHRDWAAIRGWGRAVAATVASHSRTAN